MKPEIVEKVLSSSKKVNVLNFPVGVEIYLLNPYRICNISPDGDWKKLGIQLRTEFNRFLAFSKINRIEKSPIGPGEGILFSNLIKEELNKIKANLEKPHAKIVWKIFWLNHLEEYDKLPRKIEDMDINNMSDHSKAILYHFLAINDSNNLLLDTSYKINTRYWEQALHHWSLTLNDDALWNSIEQIITQEKANGNFELRKYTIEIIKEELIQAIFNTLLFTPLKLIELDLTSKTGKKQRSQSISKFLGLILKSNLGTEKARFEQARQLAENKISKDVTASLKEVKFKKWADEGDYRALYDNGMFFIDQIHQVTESLKGEAHDENIHTSTFLTEVPKIPNIHQRVIRPLLEGIESSAIIQDENASREIKDKTFYTQMILGLRILCELNLDIASKGKIIKNIEELNERFLYTKISYKSILKLNQEKGALKEFGNETFLNRFYLTQYCYFINGEFADPDASIYKSYKTAKGIVTFTEYSFIPRSKLAEEFHKSEIDIAAVSDKMRLNKDGDTLNERLKTLKNLIPTLKSQGSELELKLLPYDQEVEETRMKFVQDKKALDRKIEKEFDSLKNGAEYLAEYRPVEIEKKKLDEKAGAIKVSIEEKRNKMKGLNRMGFVFLLLGIVYLAGSLTLFHFYGGLGISVFGLVGFLLMGLAADRKEKTKKSGSKENREIEKIKGLIKKEDDKIKALENGLLERAKVTFSEELRRLKSLEDMAVGELSKKYNAESTRLELERVNRELGKSVVELESVKAMLKEKTLVKKKNAANGHPINNVA